MSLIEISRTLDATTRALSFAPPVAHVYAPLHYARRPHEAYLKRYGQGRKRALWIGMNPGPFGMMQTGIPFGEIAAVRDWMGIEEEVEVPDGVHPKRPIQGFACPRSEVSGRRLWSWVASRFGTADQFFRDFFVSNYIPLAFLEESGRNHTPNKLPKAEKEPLFAAADVALRAMVERLQPELIVGVGSFAEARCKAVLTGRGLRFARLPHPSPASPAANRGWAELADKAFATWGLE
ncbi:MAG: single-stranded DNA-binding protein [Planctomycetota bacterium]|nr:MAG: single-stranded DNA-binding protein [Planctomycetota bacterium]